MSRKFYYRYFRRSFISFFIPMLIPLLVMGALSFFIIQEYVKENINDQNMNLLKQTNELMELIFNELDSLNLYILSSTNEFNHLQDLMNKPKLNDQDYKNLTLLKNFIDSPNIARPYIDSIYIYVENDNDKFLTSTANGLVELEYYPDFNWYHSFKTHLGHEPLWTEARPLKKMLNNQPDTPVDVITMYRKIPANNGVLVLNIEANYIENQLANLTTMAGHNLFILDERNNIIFQEEDYQLTNRDVKRITSHEDSFFTIELNHEQYVISKLSTPKYGWTYFSISPQQNLYKVPKRLILIVSVLIFVCIVISSLLALYLTKKALLSVKSILNIVEAAEQGMTLPPLPAHINDVHSYLTHNILKNFMEHNYLKVRLSEQKYKEQKMEFTALQSQLNPHFLYNTLETINWKAIALTKSPNQLNQMIENLADILRYSLDGEKYFVPILEEIKYTESYIEIQKVRYKEQFEVYWDFGDEIKPYKVKKLILQPLIENSIQHGIDTKQKCFIKVKLKVLHNHLEINVIDNGKGMSKERLLEVKENLQTSSDYSKHIGLINTHKRLKVAYGEEFGLQILSKENWGTVIRMKIPSLKK